MERKETECRRYWLGGKRKPEQDRFFKQALDPLLWQPGDADNWDACWYTGMPKAAQFREVGPDRKINHIPGNNSLTVKNRLYDTISAMRDRLCDQYGPQHETVSRLDFIPRVYAMPRDYHALQQAAFDNPTKLWILKPKNASRGKGVRLLKDVATAPLDDRWMVQEYLANTHTMHQRKYVLRLYVLIASIEPLRVYLYEQGFAKLASERYDLNDLDNRYSHLTNPDINALNTNADTPVEFVDLNCYRQWLREQGHDDEALFEKIHDLVTLTAIAAVEPMRRRTAEGGADSRGCYELLGIDCLIDDELKPWILECNLSPSMDICAGTDSGGRTEARIKEGLVADMVSLLGLNVSASASPISDPAERIWTDAGNEAARSGDFQRLYPNPNVKDYLRFFAVPRLEDIVLADALTATPIRRPQLQRRHTSELITDEQISLYDSDTGRLMKLNQTASFIWLMAMEDVDPDTIAEQLSVSVAASLKGDAPALWAIRTDVWNCLADWAHQGLLMQKPEALSANGATSLPARPLAACSSKAPILRSSSFSSRIRCGIQCLDVHTNSPPVATRLDVLLSSLSSELETEPDPETRTTPRLEIVRDRAGYSLVVDGEVLAARIPLAAVTPVLARQLIRMSVGENQMVMDVGFVTASEKEGGAVMFASAGPGLADAFASQFAHDHGLGFARGLRFDIHSFNLASALGFPGQISAAEFDRVNPDVRLPGSGEVPYRHQLADQLEGFLIPPNSADVSSRAQIVETLIVPRWDDDSREQKIRMLSVEVALADLLPSCFAAKGKLLDAETLVSLVDWLSQRQICSIDISDYQTASEALAHHLDAPHDQRQSEVTI